MSKTEEAGVQWNVNIICLIQRFTGHLSTLLGGAVLMSTFSSARQIVFFLRVQYWIPVWKLILLRNRLEATFDP